MDWKAFVNAIKELEKQEASGRRATEQVSRAAPKKTLLARNR